MQVACPSCSAEYPVDERRLPASGLKMRCPKCGARFHVHPDGSVAEAGPAPKVPSIPKPGGFPGPGGGGADLPAPKGKIAPPLPGADLPAPKKPFPKPAASAPAKDELDLDLPAPRGGPPKPPPPAGGLDLDLPAPSKPKKPLAPAFGGAKPAGPKGGELDLDLPAPRGAKPAAPGGGDLDLDLPAPRGAKPAAPGGGDLDLDLPAPRGAKPAAPGGGDLDLDLPAPRGAKPAASGSDDLDLDLPAPRGAGPADDLDLDLPAPRGGGGAGDFELDLPAPRGGGGADLPAPRSALADEGTPFDDLDLPAPRGAGEADLPAPHGGAELPAPKGSADLPGLRSDFGDIDLPQAKSKQQSVIDEADEAFGDLDLPMPKPAGSSGGFGDLDLPVPKEQADLPAEADEAFGDLELPTPRSTPGAAAFDDLDLPTPREVADLPVASEKTDLPVAKPEDDFEDLALPEPRSHAAQAPPAAEAVDFAEASLDTEPEPMRDASGRTGVGGTGFGELDLGDGAEADDMEFADIPEEGDAAAGAARDSLPPPRVVARKGKAKTTAKPAQKSRAIVWVAAVLVLLLAGGAALGLTPYGYFGINLLDQFLPGAGDPAQVAAAIESAEEQAASDRWVDVRTALVTLGEARANAGLNDRMLGRSLTHEALYQVRFGDGFGSMQRSARIAQRIDERAMEGPEVALGLAANKLRLGDYAGARASLAQARPLGDDPYVDLVLGEIELAEGNLDEAVSAFGAAQEHGGGARALWGVARARLQGDDEEATRAAIDAVLEASPHHAEAMAALGELRFAAGEVDEAYEIARQASGLAPVDGETLRVSPKARAEASTLVGRIEESRGRATAALAAYDRALAAVDAHVPAFLGAGRVLLADRPADALARFESVLQTEGAEEIMLPNGRNASQEARLGAGRAQLALERTQDANDTLSQLLAELPEDAEVLLWLGKANEARDPPDYASAEGHYREAIQNAPELFGAYLALAELFLATDRGDDAGVFLERAESEVPETAEMRYQLGAFELRRNRTAAAIHELDRALELSSDHPPALFSLAVAYRRSGQLDPAMRTFDRLAEVDPGHPGLSLERGLLFEARGESERAVESYTEALEDDPEDLDLLLRLGAAQVAAGRIDDAEATLDRVRAERPNSAEANHFVGRVAFARGNYAEALNYFRQAVQLDPSRGEFHLYVGWAALENGQLGEALHGVDAAIERDPSLGDAFWIRGVVKLRSGRPRDALTDLQHALQLKPSRYAAYAAIGDTQDQLSNLDAAIAAYETAVENVDDNGHWWYRLGRLRMDRGNRADAATALQRATLLGDAMTPLPGWLADAHRLRGEALRLGGQEQESVQHYRRYLELAPATAIDRGQVREILMDMGEVP